MTNLIGTEKQVKFAQDIKEDMINITQKQKTLYK